MSTRARLSAASVAVDVVLILLSYQVARLLFTWIRHTELRFSTEGFDWGVPTALAAVVCIFLWLGLYKVEAYVSRPLHLLTLAKATLFALIVTTFFAFAAKAPIINDSRLTVFSAFTLFFILDAVMRLWLLDGLYRDDVRAHHGGTVVIGHGSDTSHIAGRCRELRGFAPVVTMEPADKRRNGYDADPTLLEALASADPAPRQVMLDASSLGHKASFDLIHAARERGCEVYVVGRIVSPLDTTRLLLRLFEMPVMRVRREPKLDEHPPVKRAFDVVAAAGALVLLAPVFAVIAVLIKRSSPGPVFYRQTRVGQRGRTFEFLKFRSMTVGNDAGEHQEYVCKLIEDGGDGGDDTELVCTDEWGRPIYKLAEDDRVTPIGYYLRKYSLDELPQFWNVLRGDMSMVGPRPALEYEVAAYKPWHRRRLEIAPGVSGLWQVAGRSRVGFDDMVFQDVIYSYNQSLLTDVSLCLRTVPAMLIGRGAV